jgi:hypothetical protein
MALAARKRIQLVPDLGIRSERLEIGLKEAVSERAGVKKMEERPNQRKAG